MTDQHTPAPWFVNGPDHIGRISVCSPQAGAIVDMTRHQVAGLTFPIEANARLIAAAPDLLAALEAVMTVSHILDEWESSSRVLDNVKDAIRKARGEDA